MIIMLIALISMVNMIVNVTLDMLEMDSNVST